MDRSALPLHGLRLPRGRSLDPEVWESRHRWLLALLSLQAAVIATAGALAGYGPGHNALHMGAVAVFGLAGALGPRSRDVRSLAVALGLFTESALVVHLADGATAAHFHYFVMVAAVSLYEDAVPFLAAAAFVVLDHGIVGTIDPTAVYSETSSIRHPWAWAGIHGGFVAAAALAHLLAWNANERVRARLLLAEGLARDERDRAERYLHDVEAAAEVARSVARERDARATVAETACELIEAAFVFVAEPAGDDALEFTVGAGMPLVPGRRIAIGGEPSGAALAFTSAEPFFVPRVDAEAAVSSRLVEATEAVSLLFQPAISGGRVRGVLCIGWRHPVETLGSREARVAALLADEAALAIERAGQLRDLEEAATTDALTGVGNRRAWDAGLHAALAAAAGRERVSVAILDLDRFKALNDEQGHQAGDRALKGCVAAWRSQLRPSDELARLGGDEFALLLPGCDLGRAEAIRERLETLTPHLAGVSVGIAEWDGAEPAEELMRRADGDLYRRKAARR